MAEKDHAVTAGGTRLVCANFAHMTHDGADAFASETTGDSGVLVYYRCAPPPHAKWCTEAPKHAVPNRHPRSKWRLLHCAASPLTHAYPSTFFTLLPSVCLPQEQ